ncbi:class I SAM-dependent methyltransferase [Candidatus Woesearchaeota archaeon]|jgi:ubiquinone/menaquinone biosynthesis C-methylase UbiE|nr:class I SAM-dependent methyltransferase [Candidatus Woesearchaeota archaeon]
MGLDFKIDSETDFFNGLIELQYGQEDLIEMKRIAQKVSWAKGWPGDNVAFWNAEAFMWQQKIEKGKRELIKDELGFLSSGKNLDLGCGSYSYIKSVGFDFSEKMLQFNDNCVEKVLGSLEKKLPFDEVGFDSVTAIFVFNYINHYKSLLLEVRRVLKQNGHFVMVLGNVNDWQKQKEINSFNIDEWKEVLKKVGFVVEFEEKERLWFFKCVKSVNVLKSEN